MKFEPKPYWIKLADVKEVGKIKLNIRFSKEDEQSYIKFKRHIQDEVLPAVKISDTFFVVLKDKKDWYMIEESIFNRDVKGEEEVVCD